MLIPHRMTLFVILWALVCLSLEMKYLRIVANKTAP